MKPITLSEQEYRDKVYACWLGKNIGVLYGEPTEFKIQWSQPGQPHRITWQERELTLANTRDWLVKPDGSHDQDDCYVQMITLEGFEKHGTDVTSRQIAELWQLNKPQLWCANQQAFENFSYGIWPPLSGHPAFSDRYTSVDAQIAADLMGLVCPGMPNTCEKYARRQAEISNFSDGAYAAVFMAQCYSAAFFEDDLETIIRTALRKVPQDSLYARMVQDVLAWHGAKMDWRDARQRYASKYPRLGGIHAVTNSGCVLIGLLWGQKDYTRTLQISMLCGWDSDCNPATAAGILGTIIGTRATPQKWKEPLKDVYRNTTVKFYPNPVNISTLAAKMAGVGKKIILAAGGRIVVEQGKKFYEIPVEPPTLPMRDELSAGQIRRVRLGVLERALAALQDSQASVQARRVSLHQITRVGQVDASLIGRAALDVVARVAEDENAAVAAIAAKLLSEHGREQKR